jgi:hypothetical protein
MEVFLRMFVTALVATATAEGRARLVNGGYEGVVVAVSPDAPPSDADFILESIQVEFNNWMKKCN